MWRAIRAELAYFQPWIYGGLGLATGISIFVSTVFALVPDGPPPEKAIAISGMFLLMAPSVVSYVVQTYRTEGRRARLLLMGPLTPRQLAGAMVLLPVLLTLVGAAAAALAIGGAALVGDSLSPEPWNTTAYVGGLMFLIAALRLLMQEAGAAHRQLRRRHAIAGWTGFVVAVLAMSALSGHVLFHQGPRTWLILHVANVALALATMAASFALYTRRSDFAR